MHWRTSRQWHPVGLTTGETPVPPLHWHADSLLGGTGILPVRQEAKIPDRIGETPGPPCPCPRSPLSLRRRASGFTFSRAALSWWPYS